MARARRRLFERGNVALHCPLSGAGGFIAWDAFNTKCWDGSGAKYAREALVAAMILVPGSTGAVPFEFCLDDIHESHSSGAGS